MKQAFLLRIFFSFTGLALLLFWQPVLAQQTIKVKGQVGGVVAGPSSEDDSDDSNESDKDKKSAIPAAAQSTVSVEPSSMQGAVFSVVKGLPQFTTPRPAFRGTTNIQNANIFLIFSFGEFILKASTQADGAGDWYFVSPEDFPNGNFEVIVQAVHPTEQAIKAETSTFRFHVLATSNTSPWNEQFLKNSSSALFDLSAKIEEQYQTVAPGENIIASIRLINFSATRSPIDVIVEYSILDEEGREILHQQETLAVGTRLSYLKTFYTQSDLKEGTYRLIVKTPSRNVLALASTEFTVKGKSGLALTPFAKIDYSAVLLGVGFIFFTFIFLSYFEFIRFLKVKKHIRVVTSKLLKRFF